MRVFSPSPAVLVAVGDVGPPPGVVVVLVALICGEGHRGLLLVVQFDAGDALDVWVTERHPGDTSYGYRVAVEVVAGVGFDGDVFADDGEHAGLVDADDGSCCDCGTGE